MLQPEKVSGEAAEEVAHARAMSGGFRPLSSYFRQADLPYDCGMQEQPCTSASCFWGAAATATCHTQSPTPRPRPFT